MTDTAKTDLFKLDSTTCLDDSDLGELSPMNLKPIVPRTPMLTVDERDIINVQLASHQIQRELFEIPPRYLPEEVIGKGSYGMVISALDTKTGQRVAIKKCSKVFPIGHAERLLLEMRSLPLSRSHVTRQTLIPRRILREMKIMAHLNHPNIVNLKVLIPPRSYAEFKDVYFVTDLMEADLRDFLVTGQKLSDRHVQYLMYQMLSAISHVHSSNILHRDLKP